MALEDTVIVTEEQISKLYRRSTEHGHDSSSFYKVLTDNRLLPLTVEMLTTPAGMAILRLATWTYFTGNITIGKKNAFNVWIHGKQALLDNLIEKEISHPIVNFKYSKKKKEFGTIRLSKDSGSIARLVHAMGVPTYDSPFVASDMGQEATSLTKPHYI